MFTFIYRLTIILFAVTIVFEVYAQSKKVAVDYKSDGIRLMVDGKPMMINGMNWDYYPVGTNYNYSLWNQPDHVITAALDHEMSLLKNIDVNVIRVYAGIPKKWITYIYEKYGIYTMLNHTFGRYGLTIDGTWYPDTDYGDPQVISLLLEEVSTLSEEYNDTPGLLLYLLGNENNYGLFWEGAETENIPMQDRKSTKKAYPMYRLMNSGARVIKSIDKTHPVALCNGDLLFLDIIAANCPDIDILGVNMYRGISFTDAFERVGNEIKKPLLFTEFGSDAFNAVSGQEDQFSQSVILRGNWQEIYANAAGMGKVGNSIGGFTFQFSDGWWKHGQTKNLDIHDTNASWSNGGYYFDYVEGKNNMNEEWFGICAKGNTAKGGFYSLFPRSAYFILQQVHGFNPYASGASGRSLQSYFESINIGDAELKAAGGKTSPPKVTSCDLPSDYEDNISFCTTGGLGLKGPTAAPVSPDVPTSNVISIYSDTYPNVAGTDFNPAWQQSTDVSEINFAGNNVLKYAGLNYQGTHFGSNQDVSGMNFLHVDIWSANSTALHVFLISPGPVETAYKLKVPTAGWAGIDIPLNMFAPVNLSNVIQFKFEGNGDVYIDNLYFKK